MCINFATSSFTIFLFEVYGWMFNNLGSPFSHTRRSIRKVGDIKLPGYTFWFAANNGKTSTIDGSEILRSPVEVGSLSHYLLFVLNVFFNILSGFLDFFNQQLGRHWNWNLAIMDSLFWPSLVLLMPNSIKQHLIQETFYTKKCPAIR